MANTFSFQWENISVTITERQFKFFKIIKKRKHIIDNVSGFGYNSSLIALFGASGCGKTTLLGALSGRIPGKKGVLKINNEVVTNKYIRNISGYIQQEDKFTESLTVQEHMNFMTALKLRLTKEERTAKIKKLLTELCLEEHRRTIVASLSGGEKRRLSLATELINDPHMLFCDEPTTGVDSFSALSIVQKLEAVALTGKLVLMSVHQPSSQLFDLFNNLILLANGKLIFQGSKIQAKLFFESANLYCPVSFNPADFYIKCVALDRNDEEKAEKQINLLIDLYNRNYVEKKDERNGWKDDVFLTPRVNKSLSEKDFFLQLDWLVWREFIDCKRNFRRFWIMYLLLMITSLMISLIYKNVKLEDPTSVQNIQGAMLLMISELVYTQMYSVIYIFPLEESRFIWEKSVYSSFPYFISKIVSQIPACLINAVSFLFIYFALLEFMKGFDLFLSISLILFGINLCGICLGLCFSAIFSTVEYVELFIVPFDLIVTILSGIWIKIDTLPKFFGFVKYLSPFYFGFSSISTLFWEKVDHIANCTTENIPACYENGEEVLIRYGFFEEYNVVLYNLLCICILILLYCYFGYLGIIRKRALYELY